MDELERMASNSPPLEPSAETTERHRAALHHAIAAERGASDGRAIRMHPRRRVFVTAVAVVAACVAGALIVTLSTGDDSTGGRVGLPAAAPGSTAAAAPACGTTLPQQLAIPTGFGSAQVGTAPDADTPAASTQFAQTWSSAAGATIEARWPSDANRRPWDDGQLPAPATNDTSVSAVADDTSTTTKSGMATRTLLFHFASLPKGCNTLQINVYGHSSDQAKALLEQLQTRPFVSTTPLVTGTNAASTPPTVTACVTPGNTKVPNRGGQGLILATYANPADALSAFVDSDYSLLPVGYTQLQLPDGSIVYANEPRPGVIVTTVHVTAAKAGWTVADWNASGC